MKLTGSCCGNTQPRELLKALSTVVPSTAIEEALTRCSKHQKRTRALPSALVVRLIIALGLLVDVSTRQVLGFLLTMNMVTPTRQAIRRACYRIGPLPLIELFHLLSKPLATKQSVPGAYYQGLHVFAVDAANLDIPDTAENERAFGRPGASRGKSAFPQIKLVALLEAGTH